MKNLPLTSARNHQPGAQQRPVRTAFCFWVAALLLVAFTSAIRVYGALNELWLDKILTVNLAAQVTSPAQVFTRIHLENNHYLNTLWIYLPGPQAAWLAYRLPSLVAGVAAIVLAGFICRRHSNTCALLAMSLVGFSYVMVLFSGEARG